MPDSEPATSPRLLLVEDDADLRVEMAQYLDANGYVTRQAQDAATARKILDSETIDLIVLDVNLPGEDGLSLCRTLAGEGPPILMLSALGEPVDRILGLELGADDYVVKPIPPRELLARVKALLRRGAPNPAASQKRHSYSFAGFHLDLSIRQLRGPSGMMVLLTRSELSILQALLDKAPAPVSRDELLALLKGETPDVVGRGVDLHISRLRRKIQDQAEHELIRTYRGVGYMLDARVTIQ
jgi:two-component system OmpR family response regulator